jgi:FMN phosphatase YigB (HAD superfamily)
MPKSLQEYVTWLDHRTDLIWPQPPGFSAAKAKPYIKPLPGIRAVVWDVYGTLLRITDGDMLLHHHKEIRMQVALEKTINEFNMWNSMTRRPGAPWEYMLQKYRNALDDLEMTGNVAQGDFPQVNSSQVWRRLLEMLDKKEYKYDKLFYGNLDELAEKVAYFFQSSLQGVEASPRALKTLISLGQQGIVQGVLADTQTFTWVQLIRALGKQGEMPPLAQLFDPSLLIMSDQLGVRKPSPSLFATCVHQFAQKGIQPPEILYVGNRLQGDLAVAKQWGMRTVLYAGDKTTLKATPQEIKHPDIRPKRLVTELKQIKKLFIQD